jgi:hypothetical protein
MAAVHRRIPRSPCLPAARAAIGVNRTDAFRSAPPSAWPQHALFCSHIVRFDFETAVLRNVGKDLHVLPDSSRVCVLKTTSLPASANMLASSSQSGQAHFVTARTHDFAEIDDVDGHRRHALVEGKQRRARPIILNQSTRYLQDLLAVRRARHSLIATGGAGRPRSICHSG